MTVGAGKDLTWSRWVEIDTTLNGPTSMGTGGVAKLRYRRAGTLAHVLARAQFGTGAGGISSITWNFDLPSGWVAQNTWTFYIGQALFIDNSTPPSLDGRCYVGAGGSTIVLQALHVAAAPGYVGWAAVNDTSPFTWAINDIVSCSIFFELTA